MLIVVIQAFSKRAHNAVMVGENANDNEESLEFDELRKLGFEMEPQEDEFSDQPASSSRIGNDRGVQEYGIEGSVATEDLESVIRREEEEE